ncbi:hypothetical protein WH52_13140 [Tenacibaculum holothuriorum]|uniref:PsbP C-terminal domain-containing protein n=1 Tax=Tenacibaculum holothuriorum TaxID=1635173 RepID=A0A1Y2PB34_9FLAO|nr:hypothetical protein [Tenacibaculum holothuriorum]OSY87007.1 hypothetical protein WH52_13140 [Tenacibaculum holothuriorum]
MKKMLRRISYLIILLFISNCKSYKAKEIERYKVEKTQRIINSRNFTVHYPDNWYYELVHNSIIYKPKEIDDKLKRCMIEIFTTNHSIYNFSPLNLIDRDSVSYKESEFPKIIKTKFGKTYLYRVNNIYEYEYLKSRNETIIILLQFFHKKQPYFLRYTSDKTYFDLYLKDIDYFIDNLEFKDS